MPPEPPLETAKRASGSQDTLAHMQLTLESWADVLNSPLSTSAERIATLNAVERALVGYTRPSTSKLVGLDPATTFWNLQGVSGYSLAETLLALLYRLHLELTTLTEAYEAAQVEQQQLDKIQQALTQVCMSLTILQGVTLCSAATKRIMQRKSSLELLLQIVLADYCTRLLPCMLSPPSTPVAAAPELGASSLSLPSGFALDLLMCILVDDILSQERFADMGGLQQIIQLSHKCADAVASTAPAAIASTTVSALKQTDLLCLEFRYFWTQMLKSAPISPSSTTPRLRRDSETVDSQHGTPKASIRNAPSPPSSEEDSGAHTPKANRRRVTAPLDSTSDSVPTTSTEVPVQPSPRRLRHSASTVELRRRATASSLEPAPPLPRIDFTQTSSAEAAPSSSSTLQSARRTLQQRQSIASFRSLDIATHPSTSSAAPSGAQVLPRNPPGMSSRDRPRIPSPLKPRASLQPRATSPALSLNNSSRKSLDISSSAQPVRRPRASLASPSLSSISAASSPTSASFASAFSNLSRSRHTDDDVLDDIENRDPSQRSSPTESTTRRKSSSPPLLVVLSESPRQTLSPSYSAHNIPPTAPTQVDPTSPLKTSRSSGMLRSSTTSSFTPVKKARPPGATSLGLGLNMGLIATNASAGKGAKIPPSPAVRRAQLARAKSLSPTKFALACGRDENDGAQVPNVPSIPSFHLAASDL